MTKPSPFGVLSYGAYVPRWRMPRKVIADQLSWFDPNLKRLANGTRSLGNWDEDAITMAVAAGQRALSNVDKQKIENLCFASTTAPFADRSNAGLIRDVLGLETKTLCRDVHGSQRAATASVLASANTPTQNTLLLASDRRVAKPGDHAELLNGDAGAALVLGPGEGLARLIGSQVENQDFVDHYRTAGQSNDYVLEDRWIRDEAVLKVLPELVTQVCRESGVDLNRINKLVVPLPESHSKKVGRALGLGPDVLADNLHNDIGRTGVGHSLLMFVKVLEKAEPGDVLCLIGFGQGFDISLFEVTDNIAAQSKFDWMSQDIIEVQDYLKLPVFSGQISLDMGLRGEADKRTAMSTYFRRHKDINRMLGSRCLECQTPHFPAARVCVFCGAIDRMEPYEFSSKSVRVKTFTEDWQASVTSPPLVYGNMEFEGGGNAFLELTDVAPGGLNVGDRLHLHFRVKDVDLRRGFVRYFWKPSPIKLVDHG